MSDLISRNALLDAMPKNDELLSVDVRRIICESPKVDAEPVRHGKWVWYNDAIDWNIGDWVCSECGGRNENIHTGKPGTAEGFVTNPYIWAGSQFCPNCGAKMSAKEDVNDANS